MSRMSRIEQVVDLSDLFQNENIAKWLLNEDICIIAGGYIGKSHSESTIDDSKFSNGIDAIILKSSNIK